MFTPTLATRSPMATFTSAPVVRDGIRVPLRLQYLIAFAAASVIGAMWPGFILGSLVGVLLGAPWLAIKLAFAMAPIGLFFSVPLSLIWLWGALGTASAIERLHR